MVAEITFMSVLSEVRDLISGYYPTMNDEIVELGVILDRVDASPNNWATTLHDATEAVHKIKGSTGMIGFSQVSSAARSLEMKLRELAASPSLDADVWGEVSELFLSLKSMAASVRPEDSDLFNTDFTDIDSSEA